MNTVRVYTLPSGEVRVTALAPCPAGYTPDEWRTFAIAKTEKHIPELQGAPFVDLDPSDLPSKFAVCGDCGADHSVRDQWRMQDGKLAVDESVRNLVTDADHLALAEQHEIAKDEPDISRLQALDLARRRLRLHFETGSAPPTPSAIAAIVSEAMAAERERKASAPVDVRMEAPDADDARTI